MLVVVRSAEDAAAAVGGGADRLVARLPLGRASDLREIAAAAGPCPISLWHAESAAEHAWGPLDERTVDDVFVLLSEHGRSPGPVSATAVLRPTTDDLRSEVDAAAARGYRGVLFGEGVQPRRLLEAVTIKTLDAVVRQARVRQVAVGFAGSMEMPDIPRLLALAPDALLFDELVREPDAPSGAISPERIRFVREMIPPHGAAAPQTRIESIGCDRIFVRDWTVSIHVGAYAHESAPQRARFTVEVALAPLVDRVADLRGVVTYDLITDAISRATADHVDLVETIAEEVAASVLAHSRAISVDVMVEKLDLGPGSLGCRIVRGRPA